MRRTLLILGLLIWCNVNYAFPWYVVKDTTVQRKVKKTDYRNDERPEHYTYDLKDPDNLKPETGEYDEKTGLYRVGSMLGKNFLSAPYLMKPIDYFKWGEKNDIRQYFKTRNDSLFVRKGKEKFDFSDMHFDLGPAEKIFGPGGVRLKTQGSAELKFGWNYKYTDNPSISERNRKQSNFDFDEKVNASVSASIGDKMNFNINYNTDATFDFDSKNLKLAYEGKEDEMVKLLEAGNITFPSNNSLVRGAQSLFGVRADLQFGKLKLQTVFSQKKSQSKTVGSKGGTVVTPFEIQAYDYDENRHFFMGHYFHDTYDKACSTLPTITSGITINRIEVWVTNTSGVTENTRDIVGFVDLAEGNKDNLANKNWASGGSSQPQNRSNSLYETVVNQYPHARAIDSVSIALDGVMDGGVEYEKIENAKLLSSSEYSLNKYLGYISLKSTLQTNQALAVAYEYTYAGQTYQVGEFSSDIKDNNKALFVKLLKNTNNSPSMGNWRLMMKNVYTLNAQSIQQEKFKLDIKYLSDTTGVSLSYIPEEQFKQTTLLKMMNLDRLDDNQKTNPNGKYDFIDGYTVDASQGRVIFPVAEPFGEWLESKLGDPLLAKKYCFYELYDTTKTAARQVAEKDKFTLVGEYKASKGSEIDLGSMNIPQGSVVVTAGGVTLTEGSDYTVDYSLGKVTIINQSIIDAGTNVTVSLESQSEYSMIRKTMMGVNWQYDFNKNFQLGGTFLRLTEKPLTTKVSMGEEPVNNTVWGLNLNYKKQSQWLTNLIDKIPFIEATAPSSINVSAEFAQLVAGEPQEVQGGASYIDDFENTKNPISVKTPQEWMLSSVPSMFSESNLNNDVKSGYNRSRLAWYVIDPLFTRRNSSLTPAHIKRDLDQLSNHYVREVYVRELYPNKDTGTGESNTLDILNLAYYPSERGPYNLNPDLDSDGHLTDPKTKWGGMMRKLSTSDFETSNVQYIEFWLLDPFIYTKDSLEYGGKMVINLGDISEDVLKDGKKSYESGLPVNSAASTTNTSWGKVPAEKSVVYSFSTESNARQRQDVGLDGLSDSEEATFPSYQSYLNELTNRGVVKSDVLKTFTQDPAGDNYQYFRGTRLDSLQMNILDRYKKINSPQGNSPNSEDSGESFSTAYKTTPDVEDINQDYTMNEYENYYEYSMDIRPGELYVGNGYIVDERKTTVSLRNGKTEEATWYQYRIPVDEGIVRGKINDKSSIRFMRIYLTDFEKPIVLRFGALDLVRGEWRTYGQSLSNKGGDMSGEIKTWAVNIEENNNKTPVNYVLPPGVTRVLDPSEPQLTQANEQALAVEVDNLSPGDAKAVYKNMNLDLRKYKHLQLFVHANALQGDTRLKSGDMKVFLRMGSDYKNNYYEYEVPLTLTPAGHYDTYTGAGCLAVWPSENMVDIDFTVFTDIKHKRNVQKAAKVISSYAELFSDYDADHINNKVSIMGNPSLGEVKTMMIGVRNASGEMQSVEVWVNELRLQGFNNEGGWAAQGNVNMQLSDVGSVNMTGHVETAGYGGLEEGVSSRRDDNLYEWSVTTNFDLGRFFPEKWKMNLPLYYSYSWQKVSPKYNPFDTDMLLKDAIDELESEHEKDSLRSITESVVKTKNFSLSSWKSSWGHKLPLPIDPNNFTFSYAYSQNYKTGETTVYENQETWKANLQYSYSPKYKTWEPFKNMKGKSKWLDIIKAQNLNYLPQTFTFDTDISRSYYEFQERDIEAKTQLPVVFSEQFLWNRQMTLRWDIFKSMKINYSSATHAEIEEPYVVVNKSLYPDEYEMWKDSVKHSLRNMGRPLTYNSSFSISYTVPLNKIPALDWLGADGSYNATYGWTRGAELEDGSSLGNTAISQRNLSLNGKINMETLYKKSKFLDEANSRFASGGKNKKNNNSRNARAREEKRKLGDSDSKNNNANDKENKKEDKKEKGFSKEVTLNDSTYTDIQHGQNSKKLIVRATDANGKKYNVEYKRVDANTIRIKNQDTVTIKVNVVAKAPKKINTESTGYKTAQVLARGLMMIRNVNVAYKNNYSLSLPGFRTEVGNAFGQKHVNGILSPGLDFAFGLIDDSFVDKAQRNGWLMGEGSDITTPATTNALEDIQIRATLEPLRDLKIDLNASRSVNKSKSIQFMYDGKVTQSGNFTMTTISLKSAFAGSGSIGDNYDSKPFNDFIALLPQVRQQVENQYIGSRYPQAAGEEYAGKPFDPANGTVDMYSADVMIPAFLSAYCNGSSGSLDIFPALSRMLPNWSITYSGLSKLPWFADHFRSFNINHAYKSVYAVGAYNSFTNFMEYMNDIGFINDVSTNKPVPSSMYNVSTISLNESFSPLIGVDMTFLSGLTTKLEYKKTRSLNLSMTSVALTENYSNDFVIGIGYKIKDLNLFGAKRLQDPAAYAKAKKAKKEQKKNGEENNKSKSSGSKRIGGVSHDLNIKFDFSYRLQNAINRNIQTLINTGTNGSTAYSIKVQGDYTFSRMLTLTGYMDWQKNVPLIQTSSYPTVTADFGISIKFSLTR